MSTKMIDHFSNDFIVNNDSGLNLAIAFTNYDNNTEPILEKEYGELIFQAYEWGPGEDGDFFVR